LMPYALAIGCIAKQGCHDPAHCAKLRQCHDHFCEKVMPTLPIEQRVYLWGRVPPYPIPEDTAQAVLTAFDLLGVK